MTVVTNEMAESMTDETMGDAEDVTVPKTVQQLGNDLLTNLSERIIGTQTLIDLHSTMRANYEKDLKKFWKTAHTSLDKGMTAEQASLALVDKSLETQRKFVQETEEIAKYAREQLELIEERQAAVRSMVENA